MLLHGLYMLCFLYCYLLGDLFQLYLLPPESIEVPHPGGGPPYNREWILVDVSDKRQLGSPKRLKEKMVKLQQRDNRMALWAEERKRLAERCGQTMLSIAEAIAHEVESGTNKRAQEADRRILEAKKRTQEAEKEVEALKRTLQDSQTKEEEIRLEIEEANMRAQESERGMQEATRQREEADRNTGIVLARAERAEIQANKVPTLEHTLQLRSDQVRRQMQQINTLAHQLESHEKERSEQKQQLDITEEQLQSTEVEMRILQHQLEMKELEGEGREEQIQKQQEEMRMYENQFQSEKRALTSQIKSLEDALQAMKGEVSSQTSEMAHPASLHHPDTAQVQVAEVQQKVETADQAPELESLGRSRAEQEAKLLQQSQDIATYEQMLETKELEVISLQSDVKEREEKLQQQRDISSTRGTVEARTTESREVLGREYGKGRIPGKSLQPAVR